jgi:hypothetical protein
MSELSTADLAGGTTPRADTTHPTEGAIGTHERRPDQRFPESEAETDASFERIDRADTATADTASETTTPRRSSGLANPSATDGAETDSSATPLFPTGEAESFRSRWVEVQTGFVDEPRSAVEQADSLVAEMMKRLAQVFADERGKLEEQWSRGDDISTEDLRQALRRYRSFFDRLLSV